MLNEQQVTTKLRRRIDRELEVGEFIKWVEQPLPRFFAGQSVSYFLMGIPFTAFAIFWICLAAEFKVPYLREGVKFEHLFILWGVPFILAGLWMLASPLREWLKAFRTVYLITDKRAISIESGWCTTIRNYSNPI